ncbi:MAG: tRNA (adenosine(37)-N6)-dimethylallyltransferase MiaA [Ruminococcus sp.]|nr:tRNA (adenosine(37)-N6)-dimethylallyltransferase MiaA [Ruminococcus sp.]
MQDKIPLIVIGGPTASGKTAVSVALAKEYGAEIVSADSMQIYKGLSIATAKPTPEEMDGVPHHLVDFLEPDQPFSVADYVKLAGEKIRDICSRGKLPIVCGGTGLYISSLIDNIHFDDTAGDSEIRARLEAEIAEKGNHALWEKLRQIDPETAQKVHENNTPRVIRALEVYEKTGVPISVHKVNSRREESPYDALIFGLTFSDRQMLYDRIDLRVDKMLDMGLVSECREVYETGGLATCAQAIGYKELIPYFEDKAEFSECISKIKQETRHYAKRQLTWFRRVDGINWIECDKYGDLKNIIEKMKVFAARLTRYSMYGSVETDPPEG